MKRINTIRYFPRIRQNRFLSMLALILGRFLPGIGWMGKHKNIFLTAYSINRRLSVVKNNPVSVRIAPTANCNYRCLFCEIHKIHELFDHVYNNFLNLDDIKAYQSFLSTCYSLSFYGGTEEPLLNRNFGEIVAFLKSKYGMNMFVNTNASAMNARLSDIFVEHGFDDILISYHAASEKGYAELMTGKVGNVDRNIAYLLANKHELGKDKPRVQINFALMMINMDEAHAVIDKMADLGLVSLLMSRYHGGRNKLNQEVDSFEYDRVAGNKVLDNIYAYAEKRAIKVTPQTPQYWPIYSGDSSPCVWDDEDYQRDKVCDLPWTNIYFNPVPQEEDSHYVGVCNRIILFKVHYRRVDWRRNKQFNHFWNHPVLQYLRETANADYINPICKYCKNNKRAEIRNIDEAEYGRRRDGATKAFFMEFRERFSFDEITGVEVLQANPLSDEKWQEAVSCKQAQEVGSGVQEARERE